MDFFTSLFIITYNAPEPGLEHEPSTPIDADGLSGTNFTACIVA
jgi:hypothetical protein